MKRPVLTKEENSRRIAAAGADAARRKFEASREQIRKEMKGIEADVEKNNGLYPLNGGKITIEEILRRAGKSLAYLRKSDEHIVDLKLEVDAFLERARTRIAQGARSIRRTVNERAEEARADAERTRQAYAEAELEHQNTLKELETARIEIDQLQAQNVALLSELAEKTIVKIDRSARK